jgi:hypothetical protein
VGLRQQIQLPEWFVGLRQQCAGEVVRRANDQNCVALARAKLLHGCRHKPLQGEMLHVPA